MRRLATLLGIALLPLPTPTSAGWLAQDCAEERRLESLQDQLHARDAEVHRLQEALRASQEARRQLERQREVEAAVFRTLVGRLDRFRVAAPAPKSETWAEALARHRQEGDLVLGFQPVLARFEALGASAAALTEELELLAWADGRMQARLEHEVESEQLEAFARSLAIFEEEADRLAARIVRRLEATSRDLGLAPRDFADEDGFATEAGAGLYHLELEDEASPDELSDD